MEKMTKSRFQRFNDFRLKVAENPVFSVTVLLVLALGTGFVTLLLGASYFGLPMFKAYFNEPLLVLLNVLPAVLITFLLYAAARRAWIAFLGTTLPMEVLALVSFFKGQLRGDPLIPSDFLLTGEALKLLPNYTLTLNWKVWLAVIFLVFGTVFAFFFLRYRPRPAFRGGVGGAMLILGFILYRTAYTDPELYNSMEVLEGVNKWSTAEMTIARGFTYPFIYHFYDEDIRDFESNWREKAAEALSSQEDGVISEEKKVNVVAIMLESFSDLTEFDAIDFTEDVYAPWHALQKESVYGELVVSTFGGNTVDTERKFMTGFVHLKDFQRPSNSYVRFFKEQGYITEGLHVGNNWYYDRKTVHANLGFDNYYFLEDYEDANRTDDYFFAKVKELYAGRDRSAPYFMYNLSYENHGPYPTDYTGEKAYIRRGNLSEEGYNILNNYLTGVAGTAQKVHDFVDWLREDETPVVLVLFGDHKPWLGNGCSVYHELGVNIDTSTPEGFYNFYSTPYIIWANDAAKEVLGRDFTGYGGVFSPNFLMNELFRQCGWTGNAWMQITDDFRENVDVISTAAVYFRENGAYTDALSEESNNAYREIRQIEYYLQQNFKG
jgi:phosphoglycerol transferase MdoB-like AlkP superfamily enzyme